MSDVNSLFKKNKGKSKKLDLTAATAPKKASKTKAEKQKEAAEDDEWKTETKKAVVLTKGVAVAEFGKKYTEEVEYDEDIDMGTKIDMDDTRKLLQEAIKRSTTAAANIEEKKEDVKPVPEVVDVKSLSMEERFARAATSSKYVARGGGGSAPLYAPKKSLEEEYPTLGVAVAKTTPAPAPVVKKAPKKPKEEAAVITPLSVPDETVFRATEESPAAKTEAAAVVTPDPVATPPAVPAVVIETASTSGTVSATVPVHAPVSESVVQEEVGGDEVKKDSKKKKKKGGAFEI